MNRPAPPEPPPVWLVVPGPDQAPRALSAAELPKVGGWASVPWLPGALAVVCSVLVFALPRALAYPGLLQDNLTLRAQLQVVEHRMDEMERTMRRLRHYDAQLRSLMTAQGDHGPLPEETTQGAGLVEAWQDTRMPEVSAADVLGDGPVDVRDLRPAEVWGASVAERLAAFVTLFEQGEPDLNALIGELEGMNAVRDALPGIWPADGTITSGFGWRRDPMRGSTKFHAGLDVANDRGTPIVAVAPGTVIVAATSSGYGRVVEIDHGFGITTKYAQCTTLKVSEGQRVERGDWIATMGSTGKSTGPHVHFELRVDGSAVDPLKYLPR